MVGLLAANPAFAHSPLVESQLAVVAIASAVFGYWLATGLALPYARSIPGASSDSNIRGNKPAVLPDVETTPLAEATAPTSLEEPSKKNNKKKNKAKQQAAKDEAAKAEAEAEGELDAGSDSEDEKAAVTEAALGQVKPGKWEECKLVLVVNQELGMGKGKIAAQCGWVKGTACTEDSANAVLFSHATLACYKTLMHQNPKVCALPDTWITADQSSI